MHIDSEPHPVRILQGRNVRMPLPAFATIEVDPDIGRVAHALSSSEVRIIMGIAA
jgi:hypothetical protein